ncbi:MAG TPA: hypothetical protein VFP98_07570, partial [Candidatus Polarisedimenticolia bacterium]|nr:hypothetical protein [Candidatus Polarisedimenticolia bacterium]
GGGPMQTSSGLSARRRRVEIFRSMQNVTTPHRPRDYPGLMVVDVGPGWPERVIVPGAGQVIEARGGEYVLGYTTRSGATAEPFTLAQGDRAVKLRDDLPHHLAEWRVERAR